MVPVPPRSIGGLPAPSAEANEDTSAFTASESRVASRGHCLALGLCVTVYFFLSNSAFTLLTCPGVIVTFLVTGSRRGCVNVIV